MLDREPRPRDSVKTQSGAANNQLNGYFAKLGLMMNGTPKQIQAFKISEKAKSDIEAGKMKDPQPFKSNFYIGRGD